MTDICKVLVVGTGSIGKQHIINLLELGAQVSAFSYRVAQGNGQVFDFSVSLISNLEEAFDTDIDAVVVANRTDQHLDTAISAAGAKKHLFIEKPLAVSLHGVQKLEKLVAQNRLIVEVGFMLRLHPNLQWIKAFLARDSLGQISHAMASVGQWLPDWRPGTDYRAGYGARRESGGGVIFDLIHELDLMYWLFGPVTEVTTMTTYSDLLDIETESVAQICLRLQSGISAHVHLDYTRPGYVRCLEIVGRKGVLYWDYIKNIVSVEWANGSVEIMHRIDNPFARNLLFKNHMAKFLKQVKSGTPNTTSPLHESLDVLQIALACHKSAEQHRCIRPQDVDDSYQPTETKHG